MLMGGSWGVRDRESCFWGFRFFCLLALFSEALAVCGCEDCTCAYYCMYMCNLCGFIHATVHIWVIIAQLNLSTSYLFL